MGFPCGEKAHPRTTSRPSEPSWNELPIGCEQQQQHLLLPTTTNTVNLSNLNSTSRKHQQTTFHRARTLQSKHPPPASAAFPEVSPSGFHYPFNLFHPFHDPASTATTTLQQYSTIILGKLSQFITNHVAARSGGGGGGSRSPELLLLPPWSPCTRHASDGPSVHSHDTGRSSPADAIGPSEKRHHSSTPVLTCEEAAGSNPRVIVPPESAPTTTCDPAATSVAYLGGCTESSSSPSSQSISPDAGLGDCCSNHPAKDRNDGNRQTTLTCGTETRTGRGTGTGTSDARPANTATTSTATATSSHYLVRHSLCLYAASSVILALCYLTIPTVASDTPHTIRGKTRFAEGKSDKEILDHLLKGSRYDKRLLPPVDDADFCCGMQTPEMAKHMPDTRVPGRPQNRGSLTVNVSVLLLSLASPDESSLKYEVEFLLQQQWYDPRLRYANQSSYEFLNAIHHHEDIWLPDTYFIMHGDFKDPIIPMHFALRIFRNGTINYLMRRHLILSCQGRLNIFPFDDPLCSFALESISYEQSAIRYVWKNDEDTLRKSPSLTTLNAYLIQNQTITCPIKASWRGNYSCLKVDLMFTRDRAFYFTTVFIPGIILVTSSFITFWLEWNAVPARVMIGVTTMLNFFTTSNGFRSTLPVVSNLTAMNVWDGVCMCFIYASLLEFVCVNYVGRKRPLHNVVYRPGENPVTQRLPAVLNRIGIILASPLPGVKKRESGGPNEIVACTSCAGGTSPCTHSANNGCATETCFVQVRKKEPPHPIRVAKTIDVIARITFPSAYAVFLIFFFIHYKGFS
ncbi:glutamate-gated chloride channel isoform X29 [Culex quinquefasciatus]|uniref:glutamate-gated chloride channel isoform X29 n=1 Tax=Culex quinquefasciatus TaxID=7176 RepID=UPI0018E2E5E7|nr:glutamate-gated chloride channel isoform X29 [Culex quinquefasciatus]